MENEFWFDAEKELPPCDGYYRVKSLLSEDAVIGFMKYDGIGFIYEATYRPVKYWKPCQLTKKRYGKIS